MTGCRGLRFGLGLAAERHRHSETEYTSLASSNFTGTVVGNAPPTRHWSETDSPSTRSTAAIAVAYRSRSSGPVLYGPDVKVTNQVSSSCSARVSGAEVGVALDRRLSHLRKRWPSEVSTMTQMMARATAAATTTAFIQFDQSVANTKTPSSNRMAPAVSSTTKSFCLSVIVFQFVPRIRIDGTGEGPKVEEHIQVPGSIEARPASFVKS